MARTGRPLLFKSAEELQERIDAFYEYCEERGEVLTFERLAVFLGCDRKTIYNYETKDEFFLTMKAVRERIIADLMTKGLCGDINTTFGIFCLKNYGYSDKQEVTSTNVNVNKDVNLSGISTEELKKLLKDEN